MIADLLVPLASIKFTDTIAVCAFAIAAGIGLAQFSTSRKDKRYQIAADERSEYRQRAERLQEKCDKLETKIQELQLVSTRQQGEIDTLKSFPDVSALGEKIDRLDYKMDELRRQHDS